MSKRESDGSIKSQNCQSGDSNFQQNSSKAEFQLACTGQKAYPDCGSDWSDWKSKYEKMEFKYEQEKMACVYNIMAKNELKQELEGAQSELEKFDSVKEQIEENAINKVKIQKLETYVCNLQIENDDLKLKNAELIIKNEELSNEIYILKELDEENEQNLRHELDSLATQNQHLQLENSNKEEHIVNLRESVQRLENTLGQFQQKKVDVGQMKILVELLKIQIDILNTNVDENQKALIALKETNEKLQTENDEFQLKNDDFFIENEKLDSKVEQLQSRNTDLESQLEKSNQEAILKQETKIQDEMQDYEKILHHSRLLQNERFLVEEAIVVNPGTINAKVDDVKENYRLKFDFKIPENISESPVCLISLAGDSRCHGCSKDMEAFVIFKTVWSEATKSLLFTFRRDGLVFQEDFEISMEVFDRFEWHTVILTQVEDEDEFRILIFLDSKCIVDEPNDSPQEWSNAMVHAINSTSSFQLKNVQFSTC